MAYWYSSAQEIADPDKALSRWLKDGRDARDHPTRPANPAATAYVTLFRTGVRNHYVRKRVVTPYASPVRSGAVK